MGFFDKKIVKDPYGALNPEQIQMNQALGPYLTSQVTKGPELYGGQLNEPISVGEQSLIGSSNRLGALSETGYADLINPDLNTYNKQFDEWMANPQYSEFKRNVLPGLQEAMPTFSTAMGEATQRGYQDVGDRLAQQRYAGWQSAQDRRLQALGQAPSSMSQYAQTAAIPRIIQQAGLDRTYNEWVRGQQSKADSINQMLNFLGISTGTAQEKSSTIDKINASVGTLANIASLGTLSGISGLGAGGGTTSSTPKGNILAQASNSGIGLNSRANMLGSPFDVGKLAI